MSDYIYVVLIIGALLGGMALGYYYGDKR